MISSSTDTKPNLDVERAVEIFTELYGYSVTSIRSLDSYDDQNFLIEVNGKCEPGSLEDPVHLNGLVMKISNSIECIERLSCQHKVMQFMALNGFCVQRVIPSLAGKEIEMVEESQSNAKAAGDTIKQLHAMRVLTFIPGDILRNLSTFSLAFDEEMGKFFGSFTKCLQTVPNCQQVSRGLRQWDFSKVSDLRKYVPHISGEQRRHLVTKVIDLFDEHVTPMEGSLMRGLIHGDLNDYNILIRKVDQANANRPWEICGIIDWQDLTYSFIAHELAVFITYRLIALKATSTILFDVAVAIILGYRSTFPELPLADVKVLPILVMSRLSQSLCIGEYTAKVLQPENKYILGTAERGWDQLAYLLEHLEQCQVACVGACEMK